MREKGEKRKRIEVLAREKGEKGKRGQRTKGFHELIRI